MSLGQSDHLFRHRTAMEQHPGSEEKEETLYIRRAKGKGATVCIPLSMLWIFRDDEEQANIYYDYFCNLMFGIGGWTKGEKQHLAKFIGSRLDSWLKTAPEHIQTKNEFENTMDRLGVKLSHGGETLLDTTEKNKKVEIYMPSRFH